MRSPSYKLRLYEKAYKKCLKNCDLGKSCKTKCKSPFLKMDLKLKKSVKKSIKKKKLTEYQKFVKKEYSKLKDKYDRKEIFKIIGQKWNEKKKN